MDPLHFLLFLTLGQWFSKASAHYCRPPYKPPPTELQQVINNYDANPDSIRQPIRDLAKITKLIEAEQPKELKDYLSKAACENKIEYRYNIQYQDAVDLIKVKYSGLISLAMVSMIGCPPAQVHAARLRIFSHPNLNYASQRLRDYLEVLVTVSESAEIHDAFLKFYEPYDLKEVYESREKMDLKDDVENVCFEMMKRKRGDPKTVVNAQQAATKLRGEMDEWDDDRKHLDQILMETPIEQLPPILNEFKSTNNQKPLEEELSEKFKKDQNKLMAYKQLIKLGTSKAAYFADEINARLNFQAQDVERVFPVANAITMLAVLSKEDRKKVEEEYQKTFSKNLMEELYRMAPTLDFGDTVTEVLKMYLDDMKSN